MEEMKHGPGMWKEDSLDYRKVSVLAPVDDLKEKSLIFFFFLFQKRRQQSTFVSRMPALGEARSKN